MKRAFRFFLALVTLFLCCEPAALSSVHAQSPDDSFHCGTPTLLPLPAGPTPFGDPSDCSLTITNPEEQYDPGVALYRIPVVVHVIQDTDGTGFLSEGFIRFQIETRLNEDFLALPGTPGANGTDTQIQFYLATEDPNGNPASGITYSTNATWFQDSGNYFNALGWDSNRYVNIYTVGSCDCCGYVPFLPQWGFSQGFLGTPRDRVVVRYDCFDGLGRTNTHELGHYLGLYHTFDPEGECSSETQCYTTGDRICDTNPEQDPTFGCPSNSNSCGSPNPIHNYMDYTSRSCKTNFTPEQARRMRCTLENYRPILYELVCGPAVDFTCASTDTDVELSWTNTTDYESILVYRDSTLIAILLGNPTSYVDLDVAAGTYTYAVQGDCETRGESPLTRCTVMHTPPDSDYGLALTSGAGTAGDTVTIHSLLNFPNGIALQGFSFGVCSDEERLRVNCLDPPECVDMGLIVPGDALAVTNGGVGPDFFVPAVVSGGFTIGAVVNLFGGDYADPAKNAEILAVTYEITAGIPSIVPLEYCVLGRPPVGIAVNVANGDEVVPTVSHGSIEILEAPRFIRGDTTGDGVFNGLADGLYILGFQFQNGPAPACRESGDTDGDGALNGLVDALYVLGHQFQGGPPPPAPYPACGVDPDPKNSLGCEGHPGCR